MKRSIALILGTLLALLLVSCGSSGVEIPDGMLLASNGDVAYNLFVPGGWIVTESGGICGAYYSSSDKSSITMSSYYPENGMTSIDDYWQKCKASYEETYKNFVLEEQPSENTANAIIGEKSAFKYVFTADIDGESYKFLQIVAVHDNMFFTLTYTSTAENYASHMADVEKTIAEFEFK